MQNEPNRAARFVCNLALARNGQVLLRSQGIVAGQLLHSPRGNDGFGYDPLFLLPSLNLTFAELPREEKWELSHRGNAFRSLLAQLPSLARRSNIRTEQAIFGQLNLTVSFASSNNQVTLV